MNMEKLMEMVIANGLGNVIALFMVYYVVKDNTRREKENREEHLRREERLAMIIESDLSKIGNSLTEHRTESNRAIDRMDEAGKRQRDEHDKIQAEVRDIARRDQAMIDTLKQISEKLHDIKCAS